MKLWSGSHTSPRCRNGARHKGHALSQSWSMALCVHKKHAAWPHCFMTGFQSSSRHTGQAKSSLSNSFEIRVLPSRAAVALQLTRARRRGLALASPRPRPRRRPTVPTSLLLSNDARRSVQPSKPGLAEEAHGPQVDFASKASQTPKGPRFSDRIDKKLGRTAFSLTPVLSRGCPFSTSM